MEIKIRIKPIAAIKNVKTSVVNKDATAQIVLRENSRDLYWAMVDGKNYALTSGCYKCEGKDVIYSRYTDKDGKYTKIIRSGLDIASPAPTSHYVPFKPGQEVKGRLIINDGKTLFEIKFKKHGEDEHQG